jgi:hypothetical protein
MQSFDEIGYIFFFTKDDSLVHKLKGLLGAFPKLSIIQVLTLEELQSHEMSSKVVGLILDFRATMSMGLDEKEFFSRVERSIPLLRITFNAKSGDLSGSFQYSQKNGLDLVEDYFKHLSLNHRFRVIRQHQRYKINLSVLIHHKSLAKPMRATISNISIWGAYIITPERLPTETVMEMSFFNRSDLGKIPFKICWGVEWGGLSNELPGYGVKFENELRATALDEILSLIALGNY